MRLWSIHPKYLDTTGLVALWREGLLAQKVLQGKTKGYKNHPQLERFKNSSKPKKAIAQYLVFVYEESCKRGYCFDKSKIKSIPSKKIALPLKRGQLKFELNHLIEKMRKRNPANFKKVRNTKRILPNPIFRVVNGAVEHWERVSVN